MIINGPIPIRREMRRNIRFEVYLNLVGTLEWDISRSPSASNDLPLMNTYKQVCIDEPLRKSKCLTASLICVCSDEQ